MTEVWAVLVALQGISGLGGVLPQALRQGRENKRVPHTFLKAASLRGVRGRPASRRSCTGEQCLPRGLGAIGELQEQWWGGGAHGGPALDVCPSSLPSPPLLGLVLLTACADFCLYFPPSILGGRPSTARTQHFRRTWHGWRVPLLCCARHCPDPDLYLALALVSTLALILTLTLTTTLTLPLDPSP